MIVIGRGSIASNVGIWEGLVSVIRKFSFETYDFSYSRGVLD